MAKFAFLSDEWVVEARRIRAEYEGVIPPVPVAVRMNQVVKGVPFGEGTVQAHLDTTEGSLDLETGHLDKPDITVTMEWSVARALLIEGDAQAAMSAFLSGRIRVDGDISKLLMLQSEGMAGAAHPASVEMTKRIQDITE